MKGGFHNISFGQLCEKYPLPINQPAKSEVNLFSKRIIDRINVHLWKKLTVHEWKNLADVTGWFTAIEDEACRCVFMCCDLGEFYPSNREDLLLKGEVRGKMNFICVRVCGVEGRGKGLSGQFSFVCEKDDRAGIEH